MSDDLDDWEFFVGDMGPLTRDHAITSCKLCSIAVRVPFAVLERKIFPVHEECLKREIEIERNGGLSQ
jgi:hypothetical protein